MAAREDAYARWRRQPFPPGSACDPVDELHADLALADAVVADAVIPFVEDGVYELPLLDVVAELRALGARASELQTTAGPDEGGLVQDYADYLALLSLVFEDFLAKAR